MPRDESWTRTVSTPKFKARHILTEIQQREVEEQPRRIRKWYKDNWCWLKKKKKDVPKLQNRQWAMVAKERKEKKRDSKQKKETLNQQTREWNEAVHLAKQRKERMDAEFREIVG